MCGLAGWLGGRLSGRLVDWIGQSKTRQAKSDLVGSNRASVCVCVCVYVDVRVCDVLLYRLSLPGGGGDGAGSIEGDE